MFEDVPVLVKDFLEYLVTIKNRSINTVNEYYYDLKNIFKFLKCTKLNLQMSDDIILTDITIDFIQKINLSDLHNYLFYISTQLNDKSATRARKAATMKSFFKYLCVQRKLLEVNPTSGLETPTIGKRLPKYLNLDESISLLHSVKFNQEKFGKRDLCILTLFLNCGLRLSELVNINMKNIKDTKLTIIGKGNKERVVHLNNACISSISSYLASRDYDKIIDKEALFTSNSGKRIGNRMVELIVKKYVKLAGLDETKFSPHKLRHTAATLMHKHGNVDIKTLQHILGHETIATTQIYTHVDDNDAKKAIDNNPLNKI